jgi:hypothetical protein
MPEFRVRNVFLFDQYEPKLISRSNLHSRQPVLIFINIHLIVYGMKFMDVLNIMSSFYERFSKGLEDLLPL